MKYMGLVKDGKEVNGLYIAGNNFSRIELVEDGKYAYIGDKVFTKGVPNLIILSYSKYIPGFSVETDNGSYYIKIKYGNFSRDSILGKTFTFFISYKSARYASNPFVFPSDNVSMFDQTYMANLFVKMLEMGLLFKIRKCGKLNIKIYSLMKTYMYFLQLWVLMNRRSHEKR